MENEALIKLIVQCIYNVRGELKQGFLESVYKQAPAIELKANGLKADESTALTARNFDKKT